MTLIYKKNGPIHWQTDTQTFSVERSSYPGRVSADKIVELKDETTGKVITFGHTKTDVDGSGEDIYGWNYKSIAGATKPCSLLIIND